MPVNIYLKLALEIYFCSSHGKQKKAIKGKKSFIRFHEASQKPQKNMHCTKVSKGTGKRDLPAELFFSEEFTLAPFVRARIS